MKFLAALAVLSSVASAAQPSQRSGDEAFFDTLAVGRVSIPSRPTLSAGPAPKRAASLRCRVVGDAAAPTIEGELDLDSLTLTSARAGKSSLLDASKGAKLIDERCGKAPAPISSSANYEVTPAHIWGQDILQLPKGIVAAGATAKFGADLHTCSYDGDWSASSDFALTCELIVR